MAGLSSPSTSKIFSTVTRTRRKPRFSIFLRTALLRTREPARTK